MKIRVVSIADIEGQLELVKAAAKSTRDWIKDHSGEPMDLLRSLKFDAVGYHPVAGHALNCIEQINQTFTYAVALEAARYLLDRHPEANGFDLAPGAHMSMPLDIMSVEPGLVGAETFAAVDPRNNRKLAKDLAKLAQCTEVHRYVFFASPLFPGLQRRAELEKDGIEVWTVPA